jgi:hypothetical protein
MNDINQDINKNTFFIGTAILLVLQSVGMMAFISFILSFLVLVLWNYAAVTALSSAHHITWFQAWCLCFLCNILFTTTSKRSN